MSQNNLRTMLNRMRIINNHQNTNTIVGGIGNDVWPEDDDTSYDDYEQDDHENDWEDGQDQVEDYWSDEDYADEYE